MPTREEWTKVHADLMEKLRLPCKLEFSTDVKVGQHEFMDGDDDVCLGSGDCVIRVNPEVDFREPAHLILHEGAHHKVCAPHRDAFNVEHWCHVGGGGHCKHWAKVLCDMYRETGTSLPQTTSFIEFAKAAGIVRQNFVREGDA